MPKTKPKRPVNPHFNPYPKLGFWGRHMCSPFQWHTTKRLLQHILLATGMAVGRFALWPVATAVFSKHHL